MGSNGIRAQGGGWPAGGAHQRQRLTGITDGTGKVTVHATDTGASGGSARFSAIKSISVAAQGINATQEEKLIMGGYTYNPGTGQLDVEVLRGVRQGILLGGTVITTRTAPAGVSVIVRIEGIGA